MEIPLDMSKKTIKGKWKGGERFQNGILYRIGNGLKHYFAKRTTKVKHKNLED